MAPGRTQALTGSLSNSNIFPCLGLSAKGVAGAGCREEGIWPRSAAATADPQLAVTHPAAPAMLPPCKGLGLLSEESSLLWMVARPFTHHLGFTLQCSHHDVLPSLHSPYSSCSKKLLGEEAPGNGPGRPGSVLMVEVCPSFLSPVIIHPHGCCLWGWRATVPVGCRGRDERHSQPLAGDLLHRKDLSGTEGQKGCKRNQDPKAVAALTIGPSLASSCRSHLGEQKPGCFHMPIAPGSLATKLRCPVSREDRGLACSWQEGGTGRTSGPFSGDCHTFPNPSSARKPRWPPGHFLACSEGL